MNRRGFLQTTGASAVGLMLGFRLDERSAEAQTGLTELNAFISVTRDNMVTLQIHKSEMGQGVVTSLSQILADEADVDWTRIKTEFPGVKPVYGAPMMGTYGSLSIRTSYQPLRQTAAQAREMLKQAAATRWGVPVTQVRTENSNVINTATNARLTYGEIAVEAAKLTPPKTPVLKTAPEFKLIGTSPKRRDTVAKTTGTAPFGMDYKMPGMLYAAIERCPVFEGKVKSFDGAKAKAMPGEKDVFQHRARRGCGCRQYVDGVSSKEGAHDYVGRGSARWQFDYWTAANVRGSRDEARQSAQNTAMWN